MTAIGLIILLVAAGLAVDIVVENTKTLDASVVGQTLTGVNIGGFFVAGVIVGAAALLGLSLLIAGLRRTRMKARERKHLVRENRGAGEVAAERDRLAAQLEAERATRSVPPTATYAVAAEPVDGPAPAAPAGQAIPAAPAGQAVPAGPAEPRTPASTSGVQGATQVGATASDPVAGAEPTPAPPPGDSVMDRLRGRP